MSHPIVTLLAAVPKWIAIGALWVSGAYMAMSWAGIVQPPLEILARQRAEVAAITERAQSAERAIYMLQWQQDQTQRDLREVKNKLDEMSMVLYSLERRSR